MGARLVAAQNTRSLVESLLESENVDGDAAAWHAASARKKIAGALPGGIDAAKVHLDRAAAPILDGVRVLQRGAGASRSAQRRFDESSSRRGSRSRVDLIGPDAQPDDRMATRA